MRSLYHRLLTPAVRTPFQMVILPISMCKFGVPVVEEDILRGMEMAAEAEAEARSVAAHVKVLIGAD